MACADNITTSCTLSDHPDKDRDEAKDDHSANDSEAMDIGDIELKAEASILAKEVKELLVLIIRMNNMKLNQASIVAGLAGTKGGRNDRRRKSSPKG